MKDEREQGKRPESAEGEKSSKLSEEVPEKLSGKGDTPLGASDEHSDAPGADGTD